MIWVRALGSVAQAGRALAAAAGRAGGGDHMHVVLVPSINLGHDSR